MSGMVGGRVTGGPLQETLADLAHGGNTTTWRHEHGELGLGIEYYDADRHETTTWTDGVRAGAIDGTVTNLDELGWSTGDLFQRLLDRPADTVEALEGPFLITCQDPDADRHVVATDKLGARPVFYTESDPVYYASAVDVLLRFCDDPSIDVQAVSDMLLMGYLWGDHTLVEGISALRPATVLDVVGDDRTTTRYWCPDYTEEPPGTAYISELTRRYRQAAKRASRTLPETAGIWLSGGIDSRTTTSALHQYRGSGGLQTIEAYTYDANPPTRDNPEIAKEIARKLDIDLTEVPLTAEAAGENLERIVDATDGMVAWTYAANLSATYEIDSPPPVLMEGMQGELLGDHLYRHHLSQASSAVESQLWSEGNADPEQVQSLLSGSVDPLATFRTEASRSPESTIRATVLDVHFQNYYTRGGMATNRLIRDRCETRAVHADGDYLEWCAKLPRRYRKGSFRAEGLPKNGIPYEPTRAKLAVTREIAPELVDITYERSKVKPSWPYPVHVGGFVWNVLYNRLRSNPTYGAGQLADVWIRDTDTTVHEHVTDLVDAACSRDLFDADTVQELYDQHMEGTNNASMLGKITTLEQWFRTHLDRVEDAGPTSVPPTRR